MKNILKDEFVERAFDDDWRKKKLANVAWHHKLYGVVFLGWFCMLLVCYAASLAGFHGAPRDLIFLALLGLLGSIDARNNLHLLQIVDKLKGEQ